MPELDFTVERAEALAFAAQPTVVLKLGITARGGVKCWSGSVCWSWMCGHGKASASATSVMTSRFRLRNHGRTREERDPVEFSLHDFDLLCIVVLNSLS